MQEDPRSIEEKFKKCHRCDRRTPCRERGVPLCVHCRLDGLRDELERRGARRDLLASFPQRQSRTPPPADEAQVGLENLNLTNGVVRDLDTQNLEVLDWAVKILRGDVGMAPTGDKLSGLANSVVRTELPINVKNGMIESLGWLALDRVGFKLLKAHPVRT